MRPLGHLFLWSGFLAAAFTSVCRLELPSDKWATVPWLWYGVSMAIGIVGVMILRHTRAQFEADEETTEAEYSVLRQSLETVSESIGQMVSQSQHDPAEVLHRIDDQCAEPLSDFADSRQALVKRFGLNVYADVMTEFASAERYVNRCWSAAADGYVDEIKASLHRAKQHLENTQDLLIKAEGEA